MNSFFSLLVLSPLNIAAVENEHNPAQQRIKDFYLTNYKEDGTQDWEVRGQEAFIYDKYVDIDKMDAKYCSENDTILIKSQKAKLDKESMNVYLRDDVLIENEEGMTLVTDSLDWKRNQNQIKTDDWVKVDNKSMQITAKGLDADTVLEKVDFEKNVQVMMPDKKNSKEFTMITCQGPLEIEHTKGIAIFNDNVVVENKEGKLFSDKATAFFNAAEKKIIKIVSEGHVKIIKDDNVTLAQKATYFGEEEKLILEGSPKVIYFPTKNETTRGQ